MLEALLHILCAAALCTLALEGCGAAEINCENYSCGELIPINPDISLDDSPRLNITCKLTREFIRTTGLDNSHIVFKLLARGGDYVTTDPHHVTLHGRRIALLESNYVTQNNTLIGCFVRRPGDASEHVIAEAHMHVGHAPFKPVITDVKLGVWSNMSVTWRNEGVNKVYKTVYSAWWKYTLDTDWRPCHYITEHRNNANNLYGGHCDVTTQEIDPSSTDRIQVKVNCSNLMGVNSSDVFEARIPELGQYNVL